LVANTIEGGVVKLDSRFGMTAILPQLLKSGVCTSMRFSFAFSGGFECYRELRQ